MKALIVFQDDGDHWLSRFLRPGFKHCSVAVLSGAYWIHADPRYGAMNVFVAAGADFDLAAHYRAAGYLVIETETSDAKAVFPLSYANCVGVVKAILGIHTPLIFSPWRLYRHLTRT